MSNTSTGISDPYAVKSGDTLSAIAKKSGRSVGELQRLNRLNNPNNLAIGQTLYLSEQTAYGVSVLFLDALRSPIANLPYRLVFDGKFVNGKTSINGQILRQITKSDQSTVEVWTQNADKQWQQLINTVSGVGHRLITLVSPHVVIKGKTEEHPAGLHPAPEELKRTEAKAPSLQPPLPKQPAGAPSANNPRVKIQKKKAPQGQPIIEVGIEFPPELMELFQAYTGEQISEDLWKSTANGILCEPAVLKAIAHVESGGQPFWRLNNGNGAHIPAIMYERHVFSRNTGRKYDKDHPDISWPTGYLGKLHLGESNSKQSDGKVDADDIYSSYSTSYMRLLNAYRLDPDGALKACSWGRFQILGEGYEICGNFGLKTFTKKMCTSEASQIELLAGFIQGKPAVWKNRKNKKLGKHISLWDAVKAKDWKMIAFNYNGPRYSDHHYDKQLESAYDRFRG